MGPLILLGCLVGVLVAAATCVIGFARHGTRMIRPAVLTAVGGVMIWAWAVLLLGMAERHYSSSQITPWALGSAGAAGLVLIAVGIRAAMMPRDYLKPGYCRRCGYNMNGVVGATVCPECGGQAAAV